MIENSMLSQLEESIALVLEHYSNVHRGTGQFSQISTALFDYAREVFLEHFHVDPQRYTAIFCTPFRAAQLITSLRRPRYLTISSDDLGLPLGVQVIVVKKTSLPRSTPFQPGGGTVKIVSPTHVIWADAPDRFEAGTPAIVNCIAFAVGVSILKKYRVSRFSRDGVRVLRAPDVLDDPELKSKHGKDLLDGIKPLLLGKYQTVPTESGPLPYTNLDNGASTPTFRPVWNAARVCFHLSDEAAQSAIQAAKRSILKFVDAPEESFDLLYTSNTTEAINYAAMNFSLGSRPDCDPVVLNSIMEHNSNELPWRKIKKASLLRLDCDEEGFLDLQVMENMLIDYNLNKLHGARRIGLVAISGASNVLGSFNDIEKIGQLAKKYHAQYLIDGAQLLAHRKISIEKSMADYFAFSGHKAYAPFGSGGLIIRRSIQAFPFLEQEQIKRSGEANRLGILAIAAMIRLLEQVGMETIESDERGLTTRLIKGLCDIPEVSIFGVKSCDSKNFLNKGSVVTIALKNIPFNLAAKRLAEAGAIGVRSGCFCAHLLSKKVLRITGWRAALADLGFVLFPGFTRGLIPGLIRISIGLENDRKDVDHFLLTLRSILAEPRTRSELSLASSGNGLPWIKPTHVDKDMESYIHEIRDKVFLP